MSEKIAIMTLATNERYLQGAYNLYKSYLRTNSKYPFYCAIWKETNTSNFKDLPTIVIPKILPSNKRFTYGHPPIGMFSKLALFLLEQFDYILFLDSDIILYKNADYVIENCRKVINNNDIVIQFLKNHTDAHNIFCGAMFFIKPNKNIFIKSIKYMNIAINDEELFTFLYDDKQIKFTNGVNTECFKGIFHLNNWYKEKKYWETNLGNKIYNEILQRPEITIYIEEIQDLIAKQPYMTDKIKTKDE